MRPSKRMTTPKRPAHELWLDARAEWLDAGHEAACACATCEADRLLDASERALAATEGREPIDRKAQAEADRAEVARREARYMKPQTLGGPRSVRVRVGSGTRLYRGATASEGRRLCEAECECVLCHWPSKDAGERVATTGRPAQARNMDAEALMDKRARREAYRLSRGRAR